MPESNAPEMPDSNRADPTEVHPRSSATPEIVVVGFVALLIGVVTRFVTRSSLWLDEALTVDIARLPLGEITSALRHDGHPPLFYWLLHGWTEVFGTSDIAVRSLAGMFGLACLPMAWFIGRRRGGTTLAWLAVAVVSLSAFAVRYSDETRMYSMVMAEVFVGWLLLDDILRDRRGWWRWTLLTVVAVAMPWTHYWGLWMLAAVGLAMLWRLWRTRSGSTTVGDRRSALGVITVLVISGLAFVPWLPTMLYQGAHTGTPWADPMRPTSALGVTLADFSAGNYGERTLAAVLFGAALLLGVFGYVIDRRRTGLDVRGNSHFRVDAAITAVAFLIGTFLSYALRSTYASRYGAIVFPVVAVLVAAGLTRFGGRWIRFGVVVVMCGILAMGAVHNIRSTRTQVGVIADRITAEARPGDVVVVCPDQLGPATTRLVGDDLEVIAYPDAGDGRFVDWVDYADRNLASDPIGFADAVMGDNPTSAIFVVVNGSYRTFEGKCEALLATFGAQRPAQLLVADDGETYFEHADLYRFPIVG